MTTHKNIDRICCAVLALILVLTLLFMNAESFGVQAVSAGIGYEARLFDTTKVHTIDIVMDDWDSFIDTCQNEEYEDCSLLIDNEAYKNVGIRAKGNTSLSSVTAYGNGRYSFKIEFDCYDKTKSYYGLDKICLNNIIQDNTYMKDYLCYQMMASLGVASPLCSFVYITVNGEDWGLYLAVEGVEESFLERNYGNDYGELYKPESSGMGGGEKAGGWSPKNNDGGAAPADGDTTLPDNDTNPTDNDAGPPNNDANPPDNNTAPADNNPSATNGGQNTSDDAAVLTNSVTDNDANQTINTTDQDNAKNGMGNMQDNWDDIKNGMDGMFGMSMGGDDVSLVYTDDEYDSYSNIFDNAKTDITDQDKDRLIASLKQLSQGEDIENAVNIEQVIRYFVVHNFVCNFDSYTGSIIHNYYLYEKDGLMSMIPWDYNLAFGGFQSMGNADSLVNYPIDTPVSGSTVESRPMLSWIFSNEEYTEAYHEYFKEFISDYFDSGYFADTIDSVAEMIAPYVEKDPTKFCTYEEFEKGISTLKEFCLLRAESVNAQLDGTIPSTSDGQSADSTSLIDASSLTISDMGSMGNMGNMGDNGRMKPTSGVSADAQTTTSSDAQPAVSTDVQTTVPADAQTETSANAQTVATADTQPEAATDAQPEATDTQSEASANTQSEATQNTSDETSEGAVSDSGSDSSSEQQSPQPGNMQMPDDFGESFGEGFPGNMDFKGGAPGGAADGNTSETQSADQQTTLILLGISVVFLAAGLLFVFKYRRNR